MLVANVTGRRAMSFFVYIHRYIMILYSLDLTSAELRVRSCELIISTCRHQSTANIDNDRFSLIHEVLFNPGSSRKTNSVSSLTNPPVLLIPKASATTCNGTYILIHAGISNIFLFRRYKYLYSIYG